MNLNIEEVGESDLSEILELQKQAFYPVAVLVGDLNIQPMVQTYNEFYQEFKEGVILKCIEKRQIIGSVRAYVDNGNICHIGMLIVHTDYQNAGIGKALMNEIEAKFPTCSKYQLFTGEVTPNTLYLYTKLGYKELLRSDEDICMIVMEKFNLHE